MRALFLVLLPVALLLGGCPGTLLICGENWPECTDGLGTGDDDDLSGDPDFSNFDGVEYLNIDWDPDAEADGRQDCEAEFQAQGPRTLVDDQNLCPTCDEIWTVTLTAEGDVEGCLEGTAISAPASYERKVGLRLEEGVAFTIFRTAFSVQDPLGGSENDPLIQAGVGAFQGTGFTWSGISAPVENGNRRYSFYFSGEGDF